MIARAVPAILRTDGLRLLRDQFPVGAAVYVAACAIALRWLVPWLQQTLMAENGFDITPYVPLGVSYFVVVNASVITGMIGGFLLLETREERTIKALMVTPTSVGAQLGTMATVIVVMGMLIAATLSALVGVGVPASWGAVLAASALGAPTGVAMALMLATVASNKVEAFAVMKLTSFVGLLPVAGWFVPEPLQYVVGIAPPYWACKIWWLAAEGDASWGWLVVPGLLVSVGWIAFLLPRFRAAARR